MPRVVKRAVYEAVEPGLSGRSRPNAPLAPFVPPQLSLPVERPPSGPQWVHEIKLDGFRMAARIDNGRVQLLTRTGLDWTEKYPGAVAALANVKAKTAYVDGELCGVDAAGLPSFAQTQAATDGEPGVISSITPSTSYTSAAGISRISSFSSARSCSSPSSPTSQAFNSMARDRRRRDRPAARGQARFRRRGLEDDRRALRAGKPRPLAQSQSAQPPGIRRRRLVGSGRIAASSRRAATRLLHRRPQACLRRPRGHRHASQGARRSAAPSRPIGPQNIASERPAAALNPFRVAAHPVASSLGRAEACRRDHLSDLDGRQPLATHGLRRAARGQAGGRRPARALVNWTLVSVERWNEVAAHRRPLIVLRLVAVWARRAGAAADGFVLRRERWP
jgi:hypothetical protein